MSASYREQGRDVSARPNKHKQATYTEQRRVIQYLMQPAAYSRLYVVAGDYMKRSKVQAIEAEQTVIVSLLINACRDFLIRGGKDAAKTHETKAATLKRALRIIEDDPAHFVSLMHTSAGNFAQHAKYALATMAADFEKEALRCRAQAANVSLAYCIGAEFGALGKLKPTPATVRRTFEILTEAIEAKAPTLRSGLTEMANDKDIRKALSAGYRAGGLRPNIYR